MKPLRFVGSAKEDLSAFPETTRARAGYDLFMVQAGREPSDWKPMSESGSGVAEIRLRSESGTYRVIYVARYSDAIYVLHAFQKKTQKTSREDIKLAAQRYRDLKILVERSRR